MDPTLYYESEYWRKQAETHERGWRDVQWQLMLEREERARKRAINHDQKKGLKKDS